MAVFKVYFFVVAVVVGGGDSDSLAANGWTIVAVVFFSACLWNLFALEPIQLPRDHTALLPRQR